MGSRLEWKAFIGGPSPAAAARGSLSRQRLEMVSTQGAQELLLRDLLRAQKEEMWQRLMVTSFRESFCFAFLNCVTSEGVDLLELGQHGVWQTHREASGK